MNFGQDSAGILGWDFGRRTKTCSAGTDDDNVELMCHATLNRRSLPTNLGENVTIHFRANLRRNPCRMAKSAAREHANEWRTAEPTFASVLEKHDRLGDVNDLHLLFVEMKLLFEYFAEVAIFSL